MDTHTGQPPRTGEFAAKTMLPLSHGRPIHLPMHNFSVRVVRLSMSCRTCCMSNKSFPPPPSKQPVIQVKLSGAY